MRDISADLIQDLFDELLQPWLDTTDTVFGLAQLGVLAFDRELRYRAWNRYAEKVTGIPAERVIGQRAVDVFPELQHSEIIACMQRALEGASVTLHGISYRHHITEEMRLAEATYMPLRGPGLTHFRAGGPPGMNTPEANQSSGEIVGILAIFRDTTVRGSAQDAKETHRLPKEAQATDEALRRLSRDVVAMQGRDASQVAEAGRDPYETLSGREREVLIKVAEGLTNSEIGTQLCISPRTVEVHRANVMRKLGMRTQAALIRYALRRRLISIDE